MLITLEHFIWIYLTIPLLLAVSLVFTFYLKGSQFQFKKMLQFLSAKSPESNISPLGSLAFALAARVGVGTLAGVALAIYLGGPGSIFWMWASAFILAAASFAESILAQIYKKRDHGVFVGGPAYYIQYGLKNRFFALSYAVMIIITYTLGFSAVQMNSIATSFKQTLHVPPLITGIILAAITALIILNGISALAKLITKVVPLIAIFYIGIGPFAVLTNLNYLPVFFTTILSDAFSPAPFLGGGLFLTFMTGIKRGVFASEAGLGSGAHAAAITNDPTPIGQGYIQVFGIYLMTLVVVTITAFLIMVTDTINLAPHLQGGIELTNFAMTALFGETGSLLLTLAIFFFGFSTVLTAYFYGEVNLKFLTKNKKLLILLRLLVIMVVFISSIIKPGIIWSLVDIGTGLTAIINLVVILLLAQQVKKVKNAHTNLKIS